MATIQNNEDREVFERAIKGLESQIASVGAHVTIDSSARMAYAREIRRMADKLRADAIKGKITWAHAAEQAQQTRNVVMNLIRARSTPVGRALAQSLKPEGRSLNELIAHHIKKLHGPGKLFSQLSTSQQNKIYAAIVSSAGKSHADVTAIMTKLSFAGRGLIFLSLGISVFNIARSTDKGTAVKKEVATTGAGVSGGIAGGALAGLACGPGAPVCVTLGAFAGGALAAFGVGYIW